MAETEFRAALASEAQFFGLTLDDWTVQRFQDHFDLLVAWNRKLNLTRIVDPREAARFHFLESALLSKVMPKPEAHGARVIDIGSGAGFPGLPAACLWPDCEFVLVEPNGKRAVFLKEVIRKLGLPRVSVRIARFSADEVVETDVLVTRALEGLETTLASIVGSLAETVVLFTDPAMLGRAQELARDRVMEIVEIPGSENRRIGVLTRHGRS